MASQAHRKTRGRGCFGVQVFGPACVQVMQAMLRRSLGCNKTRQWYTLASLFELEDTQRSWILWFSPLEQHAHNVQCFDRGTHTGCWSPNPKRADGRPGAKLILSMRYGPSKLLKCRRDSWPLPSYLLAARVFQRFR